MAWVTPKTDWVSNPTNPVATDMNRIEGNIDYLKTDIETKKGEIVSALVDMNQASTIADSYATLGLKIKSISKDASATIAQVLVGATFYQDGIKKTGTMVNRGNITTSLPINGSYTIPQGYHAGSGVVSQSIPTKSSQTFTPSTTNQTISSGQYLTGIQTISGDADLVAGNIKSGANIFGVVGNYIQLQYSAGYSLLVELPFERLVDNLTTQSLVSTITMNVGMNGSIKFYLPLYTTSTSNQTPDVFIYKNNTLISTLDYGSFDRDNGIIVREVDISFNNNDVFKIYSIKQTYGITNGDWYIGINLPPYTSIPTVV